MKYLNGINYNDCVGKICKSKSSGDFKIVKYNNARNVEIKFLKTEHEMVVTLDNVRTGLIKDPYSPSVHGVGVSGTKYPIRVNGILTKEYNLWCSMLTRCYSDNCKKKNPTYEGCKVSDNFKSYEYFYEWCNEQIGFGADGFELDKDLLIKGNKVYNENTCIFIPKEINSLLVKCTNSRGKYLIGVSWHDKGEAFEARVSKNKGKREFLGLFNTEIEAFNAYKTAKESFIKEQADKWKDKIDPRAYNALMNYTVEITD